MHIHRHREYSASMREKLSAMHAGMTLFLAERPDAPLACAIDPDWLAAYGRFLFGGGYAAAMKQSGRKGKFDRLSPRTLAMHLVLLRSIVRSAIREGLLPAIDLFPSLAESIKGEFGLPDDTLRELLPADTRGAYDLRAYDFDAQGRRLAAILLPSLSTRPRIKKALPALIYLMGVYAYGLEPRQLLELRIDPAADFAVDQAVTMTHPRLGITLTVPERALRISDLINRGCAPDGYLIRRRPGWAGMTTDQIADQLQRAIDFYMKKAGIQLYRSQSIHSDWLCMLAQAGAQPDLVSNIARGRCLPGDAETLGRLADNVLATCNIFRKRWHILCSYTAALDSTALRAHVVQYLRAQGVPFDRARESYDPQMIEKRLVRGKIQKRNNPAISRYLFLYVSDDTAALIDKMNPNAAFLRVIGGDGKFAAVPHADVIAMVRFLSDFRDDVQLVDIALGADSRALTEGVKVRILSGPFAGFEGTISQVLKIKQGNTLNINPLEERGGGVLHPP